MNFTSWLNYLVVALCTLGTNPANQNQTIQNELPFTTFQQSSTDDDYCATHHLHDATLQSNPVLQEKVNQMEADWKVHFENHNNAESVTPTSYILPVVFHIIHQNGAENIPDATVLQALQDMNDAFANTGYYDQGTGVDTEIQFCLAKQDPDGNATTGINRVVSPLTEFFLETQDIAMKDLSRWEPTEYINIWLVREICSISVGCGVAGYAYFPSSHGNPEDGIVVEAEWAGSSQANSSVLAHEMGHYLGLYHTFQDGCGNNDCLADGDRVCDTPPDQTTVPVPCNLNVNSCNTDVNLSDPNNPFVTDQDDMFWNYMDYGDWNCYSAFTAGQDVRMDFFIEGARASLLNTDACLDPCPTPIFLSVTPCDSIIEIGETISFVNTTMGATDFEWTVNGSLEATTTNFTYTFNTGGTFSVVLTATNGDTTCTTSKNLVVIVNDCDGNAHVSDVAGTDAPGCGLPGNPCQTIQYALDNILCSGDTVFIHSGTYQLPTGLPNTTPIAKIPENYSVTFYGVEDNGPVIIDGNNEYRGFQYNYYNGNCPDSGTDDGIDVSNAINFAHLSIINVYLNAFSCTNTNKLEGGGIQIFNSIDSDLSVSIRHCIFEDNFLEDPVFLNNNGRSVSGAAVYINGLVTDNNALTTSASVVIDSCSFSNNRCHQMDNGGHGGAVFLGRMNSATITHSTFCNNEVYSENADQGDMDHDRNAGGAILINDIHNQFPGHEYLIDYCSFIDNSATSADGATFTDQSEGAAVFLTRGDGLASSTSATLTIGHSQFYANNIETGIEHVDNNSGTLDLNSIGVNVFEDELEFDLVADTVICSGTPLFAPVFIAGATYEWSTGETGPVIEVTSTGTYAVTVTAGQCQYSDDIFILVENCAVECENTYFETIGTISQDEGGMGILPSGDGNYYVKGYQDDHVLLIKITPDGEEIWSRTLKFTSEVEERLHHMILDSEGYLVGCGNAGATNVTFEGFIFKYDPDANVILWSSQVNTQVRTSTIIEPSPTDNYRVTGISWFNSFPGQAEDGYILSIDRNTGALSGEVASSYTTGDTDGLLSSVVHDGFIYSTGVYNPNNVLGGFRGSVSKFDLLGNEQWSRMYIRPLSTTARMYGADIEIDQDSIVVVYYGDDSGLDFLTDKIYLSKSDIDGNVDWARSYSFAGFSETFAQELLVIEDGYLVTAYNRVTPEEIVLMKINKDGDLIWAKSYSSTGDESMNIPATKDQTIVANDRIYIVGKTTAAGAAQGDVLVIKTDLDGNLQEGCPFVSDMDVAVTPYTNPFDGAVSVTTYDSPLTISSPNASVDSVFLTTALSCIGACTEICDNGIDDDNDGLVDYYDPDCPCVDSLICGSPYFNVCAFDCNEPPLVDSFTMSSIWNATNIRLFNQQAVGDIDGDCISDIVAIQNGNNQLVVLNASDGTTKYTATFADVGNYSHIAIGDVDFDGMMEIFINNPGLQQSSRLQRIDYVPGTNSLESTWTSAVDIQSSDPSIPASSLSPSLADFNYDGVAEVYLGNHIFRSIDGTSLVNDSQNNQGTYPLGTSNFMTSLSVAADVLADGDCANCEGLELIAGNQVYSVDLNGMVMNVEKELPNQLDGATRIVDFDRDGDLDAVVTSMQTATSGATLYVWDLQTETLIGNVATVLPNDGANERIGAVSVGDVDNDGWPEIIISTRLNFSILEDYQNGGALNWGTDPATLKASINTSDTSGGTGASIYDFNGDGSVEVVYRDETSMRIFDENLNTIAEVPCASGTAIEYPIIADIDSDEQTELLCGCTGSGLNAFRSENTPWVKSRKIWNQYNYFVVNVHDDGTIPTQQQTHHIVGDSIILNNFLQQQAIYDDNGAIAFPTADWAVNADSLLCNMDSLGIQICNFGDYSLSFDTPVAIYDSNPTTTAATLIGVYSLGQDLPKDSCINWQFINPDVVGPWLYAVVNDDGSLATPFDIPGDFPVTDYPECNYLNNIDSFIIGPPVMELDLGPDTTICDNGQLVLNAGSGFDSYEWHDGSTDSVYTAYGAGEYWVEVSTYCGLQRDTINIAIDLPTIVELPDTMPMCGVPCVTLTVTDWYDTYEWFPADYLDCSTCPTVTACPPEPITYTVLGSSLSGCFSIDSVTIIPVQLDTAVIDTLVCLGESVVIGGEVIEIGESDTFYFPGPLGCENATIVNVGWNGGEDIEIAVLGTACVGEFFEYDGVQIPAGGTMDFNYTGYLGCDSVIHVDVLALPTYEFTEMETICFGDSILVFGTYVTQDGTYSMTFNTADDCDSTINVVVDVLPQITLNTAITNTCEGMADGGVTATAGGGSGGGYMYEWSTGAEGPTIIDLAAGSYGVTVTDGNDCIEEFEVTVGENTLAAMADTDDVTCNGAADGMIEVLSPMADWTYSLNGADPQASPVFTDLPAGDYAVAITDGAGCTFVLNEVINEPAVLEVSLISDVTITLGDDYTINVSPQGAGYDYNWSPTDNLTCPNPGDGLNCPNPTASGLTTTTEYSVTVSASGNPECLDTASIRITPILDCGEAYEIPNAFTPDADGVNDYFGVIQEGLRDILSFEIYNRWGEKVFEDSGLGAEWDGTIKGKPAPSDVYIYMIRVICPDLEEEVLHGDVTLVR